MLRKLLATLLSLTLLAAQAGALTPAQKAVVLDNASANVEAATISFLQCAEITTDQQTHTFSSHNTGTESADRVTIVAVSGDDGAATDFTIDTLTVGGDSATKVVTSAEVGTVVVTAIFAVANAVGTSEDIVVNFSEVMGAAAICTWQANDVSSITAAATNNDFETSSSACTLDLNVPADGISISAGASAGAASTATFTGHTERADVQGTEVAFSAGDYDEDGTESTPLTATIDYANANDASCVAASFR
jgi:hypothetical protein